MGRYRLAKFTEIEDIKTQEFKILFEAFWMKQNVTSNIIWKNAIFTQINTDFGNIRNYFKTFGISSENSWRIDNNNNTTLKKFDKNNDKKINLLVNCREKCNSKRIELRKPKRMKEKVSSQVINNIVYLATPDFEDFASKILHCKERRELSQTVKILGLIKGFKIIVPHGNKEGLRTTYQWHKTGFRYRVSSTKRTNCPFEIVYEKVPGQDNYFLYKYRHYHNHPLDEMDVFLGESLLKRVDFVVSEINKRKNDPKLLEKLKRIENYRIDTKEEAGDLDFEQEIEDLKFGRIDVEDTGIMRPWNFSATNMKIFQMDAIWKSIALWEVKKGDVNNQEIEGRPSTQHVAEVYLNTKEFDQRGDPYRRPRLKIIDYAREVEIELTEWYYNEASDFDNFIKKQDNIESTETLLESFTYNELPENVNFSEDIKEKYSKLTQLTEKISPYRIYEVPDEWDDRIDKDPLDLLQSIFPIYEAFNSNEEIEEKPKVKMETRSWVKNEEIQESSSSQSDENNKDIESYIKTFELESSDNENGEEGLNVLQNDDINTEINQEIENDIWGIESNKVILGVKTENFPEANENSSKKRSKKSQGKEIDSSDKDIKNEVKDERNQYKLQKVCE